MRLCYPAYFTEFRCVAAACPDSCCKEWDVAVDPEAAARYQAMPGALGEALRQHMYWEDGDCYFRNINGRCPMWRQDGLCRIQAELGHDALCMTCRDFPRLTHDFGDFVERGLELSCPEAAKLILSANGVWVQQECPGGETPEYDGEAMAVLLRTRAVALRLLEQERSANESLAILMLYGYHAQAELDGGEVLPFDPDAALTEAGEFAKDGNIEELLDFFQGLEVLSQTWPARLNHPQPGQWVPMHRNLARYFVERYWLQAVSDYDLVGRVKLAVISCLVIWALGGDLVQTAQAYSKEIENDADNVEAILDGAYADPALTDQKILSLLLQNS